MSSESRPARTVHRWAPITDLPADGSPLATAAAEVAGLRRAWIARKEGLSDLGAVAEFTRRLVRSWSIETGILEGLYTLDRGVTQTLVERGLDAALVPHGASDLPAQRLIQIVKDHERAAEGLFAFVAQRRELSTSYVKELHQVLTAHQETCEGIDPDGRPVSVPLRRGEWKLLPNNPVRGDTREIVHEYCPPLEVSAEMDRLVALHATRSGLEAEVSAAWLHHRFTQIHPFQDGNGRVARALASLVLLRAGGFPLVIDRDQRPQYIAALRAADAGDLLPLVSLFASVHKRALLNASSEADRTVVATRTTEAILADAAARLRAAPTRGSDALHALTDSLAERTYARVEALAAGVERAVAGLPGASVRILESSLPSSLAGVDAARLHIQHLVELAATELACRTASNGHRAWVELRIVADADRATGVLISLQHLDSADSNVMAAIAQVVDRSGVAHAAPTTQPCCTEPFTFTADREPAELGAAYDEWLERSLTLGLEMWRRSL